MNIYPDWLLMGVGTGGGDTIIQGSTLAVGVLDEVSLTIGNEIGTDNLGQPLVTGGELGVKIAGAIEIETELD